MSSKYYTQCHHEHLVSTDGSWNPTYLCHQANHANPTPTLHPPPLSSGVGEKRQGGLGSGLHGFQNQGHSARGVLKGVGWSPSAMPCPFRSDARGGRQENADLEGWEMEMGAARRF